MIGDAGAVQNFPFPGQECLQHEAIAGRKEHRIRSFSSQTPKNQDAAGAVLYEYKKSIALGSKMAAVVLKRVVDRQERDLDKNAVVTDRLYKNPDIRQIKIKLSVFMLRAVTVSEHS